VLKLAAIVMLFLSGVTMVHAQSGAVDLQVTQADWCVHAGQSVWRDRAAPQTGLGRITLDLTCEEGVVTQLRVKAETRCGRMLCTWGFAEIARMDAGAVRAVFVTFTATRSMHLVLAGEQMNVDVLNEYHQSGREPVALRASLMLED
jgi:hypothetical protein